MYSKKTRIISFLMAFLLIFTFAFINPLTVSKSNAVAFIPALSTSMVKIIAGVLASAGIGITAGNALQEVDYQQAVTSISNVVYRTLNGAQKIALGALSIVENIVDVPISLYNAIVNNAKLLFETSTSAPTLSEQGLDIRYQTLNPNSTSYPELSIPFYFSNNALSSGAYDYKKLDMTGAIPYFIYDGSLVEGDAFSSEGVVKMIFDYSNEEHPIYNSSMEGATFLTPTLEPYGIAANNSGSLVKSIGAYDGNGLGTVVPFFTLRGTNSRDQFFYYSGDVSINERYLEAYFVRYGRRVFTILDIYDLDGNFIQQRHNFYASDYGINQIMQNVAENEVPTIYDTSITVEETPAPVITNTDGTSNVLTLPTTVADSIGLTSTDVNVGSTDVPDNPDVPDTPNTETMENINTNVGELVTGGEIGEQVNTNIGTLEGLHGEITEQVDFGAIFDTIAEYISALNISSVTWFTTSVASFLVPFMPLISLGMILIFIDRVLNGGA